ncbi:MAG TPA: hypothetical protein VKA09_05470 [Nitrososphaeraceae archaeon]|nr:hypothetical protein [Nitrososphaeraceae archaeon]
MNKLLPVPVFPEQEEMDRVGFEPTTSAGVAALLGCCLPFM